MTQPQDLRYSHTHEWVRVEDRRATIGITDYAQSELGEIVYLELPKVGQELRKGDPFGVVESVKAVEDLIAPVSGKVLAIHEDLLSNQTAINQDPYGEGWLVTVELTDPQELADLMDSEAYARHIAGGGH